MAMLCSTCLDASSSLYSNVRNIISPHLLRNTISPRVCPDLFSLTHITSKLPNVIHAIVFVVINLHLHSFNCLKTSPKSARNVSDSACTFGCRSDKVEQCCIGTYELGLCDRIIFGGSCYKRKLSFRNAKNPFDDVASCGMTKVIQLL